MRMSQVSECINKELQKHQVLNRVKTTNFIIFDKCRGIVINNFSMSFCDSFDYIIIPVCIRQEYYSHMVLFHSDFETLYYYDPAQEECDIKLYNFLNAKMNTNNFIQVKDKSTTNKIFDCTKQCLNYIIITLIKWNKNRK